MLRGVATAPTPRVRFTERIKMRFLVAVTAAVLAVTASAQTPPAPVPEAPAAAQAAAAATPVIAPAAPSKEVAAPAVAAKKSEKAAIVYVIAEKSTLSISGRAWAEFHNVGATAGTSGGAAVADRWRVHNNSSYLRVRGETELSEGWSALAQIEAEFGIDGENGTPFGSTRNTGVGLESPGGTLIAGRWDSPTKQTTIGLDPFGGTGIFGYYNVMGQQQVSATTGGSNRWDRRLNNSLSYWSPEMAGFKILAAYSVGEARTGGTGTIKVNPYTASVALHYRSGPFYAGVSYETRNDCGNPDADAPAGSSCSTAALGSATQPRGTDSAMRVGASYDLKKTWTKVALAYEQISLEAKAQGALPEKTLSRDTYWGVITQGIMSNNNQLILVYGMASKASGKGVFPDLSGTDAAYVTAAFRHYMNKDTDVYVGYTSLTNGKNAMFRFGSGNFGNVPVGSTSTGYGVGLRYFF
jgi:predicted porin